MNNGSGSSVLAMLCASAGVCLSQPQPYPLRDAVEFSVRGGLPNVVAKLKADGAVRVAYLGGSITAQPGWRPQTLAWFQGEFPAAQITEINAAIGGTGSDLGVFRLRQDVLRHEPDLLFVEFAVNDGGAEPERILRSMEGIVRQTWQHNPGTDICFVYTLTQGMLGDLQNGKFPRAASVMEDLADAYRIPSIHMGLSVARLEKEGKVVFTDKEGRNEQQRREAMAAGLTIFSQDGVHPHPDSGHVLYLDAVVRAMKEILPAGAAGPHALGTPLRADNWEAARMVRFGNATLSPEWQQADPATDGNAKAFAGRLPEIWRADRPGASVTFRFKGTLARVYDLVGPKCGTILVTVDGKDLGQRPRFDAYCTYYRLQTMAIAEGLADDIHTVRLEIAPEPPDKRTILQQRAEANGKDLALDAAAFAAKYDGQFWYAGWIMLLGELVE
jgi:lysophospholipase L1-like esterase